MSVTLVIAEATVCRTWWMMLMGGYNYIPLISRIRRNRNNSLSFIRSASRNASLHCRVICSCSSTCAMQTEQASERERASERESVRTRKRARESEKERERKKEREHGTRGYVCLGKSCHTGLQDLSQGAVEFHDSPFAGQLLMWSVPILRLQRLFLPTPLLFKV
jgi:hypothetical protein